MDMKNALEGIDNPDVLHVLKPMQSNPDMEKIFWQTRKLLLEQYGIADPLQSAHSHLLASMPLFLAHGWKEYLEEHHPRVRLHLMLEFVELVVRFSVAVLISQVRWSHDGKLPDALSTGLMQLIRSPTLGQWLGMLRLLQGDQPKAAPLLKLFGFYQTVDADHWFAGRSDLSENDSILVLRNHVAHGGGFSHTQASKWVEAHHEKVESLLNHLIDALGGAQFISADDKLLLMGDSPKDAAIDALPAEASGCWIQCEDIAMPLWPLADYSSVRRFDKNGQFKQVEEAPVAQLYASMDKSSLNFTPLGSDACLSQHEDIESFRQLFALDVKKTANAKHEAFRWDGFIDEARQEAEHLVGRAAQIKAIKTWLKSRDTRQPEICNTAWVHGKAGMGKSMLISRIVKDLSDGANYDKSNGLFYYRFRAGDARNSQRMFLKLFQEALWHWQPLKEQTEEPDGRLEGEKLLEDIQLRLSHVEAMKAAHAKATAPRYLIVLDGLDEVVAQEPTLISTLKELCLPGVMLIISSRNEQGIGEIMREQGAEMLFPEGLESLNQDEIRAMLENELRSSAAQLKRLASFDAEEVDDDRPPENSFIEKVARASEGLPIYIHLLVDDLKKGIRRMGDDSLPESLREYYDEIMNRIGLSDVRRDLTEVVAVLAVSREPMEDDTLAQFLANGDADWESYRKRTLAALEAGSSLLRLAPAGDEGMGYTTYHQSYRDYLVGNDSPIQGSIQDALKKLLRLAKQWQELPDGKLKNHLFRHSTHYAIQTGQHAMADAAFRLCSFSYLMERLKSLPASHVRALAEEYDLLEEAYNAIPVDIHYSDWKRFMQGNTHLLEEGDALWPANRVLLQLGIEHADDSPITIQAEQWLAEDGNCDWLWVRSATRPKKYVPDPCLRVLKRHTDSVRGAKVLDNNRALSWDCTLHLWDLSRGENIAMFEGHTEGVKGVHLLDGDRVLSWSSDNTLRLWNLESGACIAVLKGHTGSIYGVQFLDGDRVLSWSGDGALRIWDLSTLECLSIFEAHESGVAGVHLINDDSVLSWGYDDTLRIWNLTSGECVKALEVGYGINLMDGGRLLSCLDNTLRLWDLNCSECIAVFEGHTASINGVKIVDGNHALSWSWDRTLRFWDLNCSKCIAVFEGHADSINGVKLVNGDHALSWSSDSTLRLWALKNGKCTLVLEGHTKKVEGVKILDSNRVLSWSSDNTLRLWNLGSGACIADLKGHTDSIRGVQFLDGDRVLSWSGDNTLRLWDLKNGKCTLVLEGHIHSIQGVRFLDGDRALSWSMDNTLRLWDLSVSSIVSVFKGHEDTVIGIHPLDGNRVLSWGWDSTLRLWDLNRGTCILIFEGHENTVDGIHLLDGNRVLSWGWDSTLRLWDLNRGTCILVLEGHTGSINGVKLTDGELALSWSTDNTLRLWDLNRGKCLEVFEGHTGFVDGALLMDGDCMLSWSYDNTLRLWDLSNGKCTSVLEDTGWVRGALLPDSHCALSWSVDKALRLWDLNSGLCISVLAEHSDAVRDVELLDGNRALSWSIDGSLRLWNLRNGVCISVLEGHTGEIAGVQPLDGDRILSWGSDQTLRLWDLNSGECLEKISSWLEEAHALPEIVNSEELDWLKSYLTGSSVITAYQGSGLSQVRWYGNQPKIKAFTESGAWLVVNASKEVRVLHPWLGNRPVRLPIGRKERPAIV